MCCGMFSRIPSLYPVDARSTHTRVQGRIHTELSSDVLKGAKLPPVENGCSHGRNGTQCSTKSSRTRISYGCRMQKGQLADQNITLHDGAPGQSPLPPVTPAFPWSLNKLSSSPVQDLCVSSSLCLECSSPDIHGTLPGFLQLSAPMPGPRQAFPEHPGTHPPALITPHPITLPGPASLPDIAVCLPSQNGTSRQTTASPAEGRAQRGCLNSTC